MRQEEHDTLILRPGRPTGGLFGKSLTVGPYEVGIVVRDGELQPPFSEGTRKLPRGSKMETYMASTAPFNWSSGLTTRVTPLDRRKESRWISPRSPPTDCPLQAASNSRFPSHPNMLPGCCDYG